MGLVRPTPFQSARPMALSAMVVECGRFILFILSGSGLHLSIVLSFGNIYEKTGKVN